MRLFPCWFCGSTIYPGHGIVFVRNDCKVFRFCRSKCHKNFKMKRNPRKVKWTKAFRAARGKDMVSDRTLEFAKKRNRPIKYDREIWNSTLRAMKRIEEIKIRRQEDFYRNRMKDNPKKEYEWAKKELARDIDMVMHPLAQKKLLQKAQAESELVRDEEEQEISFAESLVATESKKKSLAASSSQSKAAQSRVAIKESKRTTQAQKISTSSSSSRRGMSDD